MRIRRFKLRHIGVGTELMGIRFEDVFASKVFVLNARIGVEFRLMRSVFAPSNRRLIEKLCPESELEVFRWANARRCTNRNNRIITF